MDSGITAEPGSAHYPLTTSHVAGTTRGRRFVGVAIEGEWTPVTQCSSFPLLAPVATPAGAKEIQVVSFAPGRLKRRSDARSGIGRIAPADRRRRVHGHRGRGDLLLDEAVERLFGYPASEVLGRNIDVLEAHDILGTEALRGRGRCSPLGRSVWRHPAFRPAGTHQRWGADMAERFHDCLRQPANRTQTVCALGP